jgi:hypothetical protein
MTPAEVAALVLSALALYLTWRKSKSEIHSSSGDAAESYANASKTYADEVIKMRGEIDELRRRDGERARQLDFLSKENGVLRDWAERLCYQVKSLGGIPVLCKSEEESVR